MLNASRNLVTSDSPYQSFVSLINADSAPLSNFSDRISLSFDNHDQPSPSFFSP